MRNLWDHMNAEHHEIRSLASGLLCSHVNVRFLCMMLPARVAQKQLPLHEAEQFFGIVPFLAPTCLHHSVCGYHIDE